MSGLAEDALALVAEHTALHWQTREAQHVWLRARGVCAQVRARYAGVDAANDWQGGLVLAAAGLEVRMNLAVVDGALALDRTIRALCVAPRWLRLRRDLRLALPDWARGSTTRYQLEEPEQAVGTAEHEQAAGTEQAVPWPARWPTPHAARALAMQLLRALSSRTLTLVARATDKPVDIYCRAPLFPSSGDPAPSALEAQMGDVLGLLGRVMEEVDELRVQVHGDDDATNRALSGPWVDTVCLAVQRRMSWEPVLFSFLGHAWGQPETAHRRRLTDVVRKLKARRKSRRCTVVVSAHAPYGEQRIDCPGGEQ